MQEIEKYFGYLGYELIDEMCKESIIKEVPKNTELIREGQNVIVVPIVLQGLVKVFMRYEDRDFLLYYIQPSESCMMSFAASLKRAESKVYAITVEESRILLIPSAKISSWIIEYPQINLLFYQQYDQRYTEMIDAITHSLFDRLDKRILDYLSEKVIVTRKNPIKVSHKEIANELGTAREVVSRIIKKLEKGNKLRQYSDSIEVLDF